LGGTPCNDHGACVDGDSAYACTCDAGWRGVDCAEADDCVGHMCQHGGRCVDGNSSYTCECSGLDFEGQFCQLAIDNCASSPCLNGGACTDIGAGFVCDCTGTGFSGATCQDDYNECAAQANVCGMGTCESPAAGGGYTCQCPDGMLDVWGDGTDCAQVVSLSAGARNTCAISAAGSLHCWGDNEHGQLGQGHASNPVDPAQIRAPVRVGTGSNWSKVSVGGRHICATDTFIAGATTRVAREV
jgi:hypothetical protein